MNIHETETIGEFEKLVKLPEMDAPEDLQEIYPADAIGAVTFALLSPISEGPFSPVIKEGLVNAALCLRKKIIGDLAHMKNFPRRAS